MRLFFLISLLFSCLFSAAQTFDTLQLITSTAVYFDFGKADIRSDADSTLKAFVTKIPDNATTIYVTAHTDSIGNPQNNLILSEKRANAVKDTLVTMGIAVELFETDIFGEGKPIAANDSEKGRQQNRRATIEIFRKINMKYISGQIIDPETGKGIKADVIVRSPISRDSVRTDSSGNFRAKAPLGGVVGIDVFAEDYFFETFMQRLSPKEEKIEVEMKPLKAGASVDIKNFYFVGDQAVLLERSRPELPKLLKFMQYNKDLKIEIAGHVNRPNTEPVSTQTFSYRLSVDRAQMVHDYLIQNGIEAERLTYKGYGNWKMRFPTARSEEEQAANRRVEIKVLSLN